MLEETGTWHHGLVARWWGEVNPLEADKRYTRRPPAPGDETIVLRARAVE